MLLTTGIDISVVLVANASVGACIDSLHGIELCWLDDPRVWPCVFRFRLHLRATLALENGPAICRLCGK